MGRARGRARHHRHHCARRNYSATGAEGLSRWSSDCIAPPEWVTFFDRLRELGWVDERDFVVEQRQYADRYDRVPDLAAELVRTGVDVFVVGGGRPMQLRVGDRIADETGEWEVAGRPFTTAVGKNAHVRLLRVDQPA